MLKLKSIFKISSATCHIKSDPRIVKARAFPQLLSSNVKQEEDPNYVLENKLSTVHFSEKTQALIRDFVNGRPVISTLSSTNNDDLKNIVVEISQKVFANIDKKEKMKILNASNRHSLVNFVDLLRNEMIGRLKKARVEEDKYISLNNENFHEVLEFSKSWIALEERKQKPSFVFWVVNNIGDSSTGVSMARFRHFTKDSFVTFCILTRHVSLMDDFHTFYVLIKFLDLFDQMNQSDIADVCATIYFHNMHLSQDHPVNINIKTKLLKFVIDNFLELKSRTLEKVCAVLNPSVEHQFPHELISKVKQIQEMVAGDVERFDTKSLLLLINVTNNSSVTTGDGVNKDLIDVVVSRLLRNPEELISKDMACLSLAISKHRNTPNSRHLLLKLAPMMMQLIEEKPVGNARNIIYTTLQMAHVRLYVPELLEKIFSCRKVSRIEDGTLKLAKELIYKGGGSYNTHPGHAKVSGDLIMLQGMIEMELPDFRGKMIEKSDLERKLKAMRGYSPLEVRNGRDSPECGKFLDGDRLTCFSSTTNYFLGYFVRINLEVYDSLSSMFGSDCVWETFPLPFSSQVCYVVGLDSEGRPEPIREVTRQQDPYSVKVLDHQEGVTWVAVITHHSRHHNRVWIQTGGQPVMSRLLGLLGIRAAYINTEDWEKLESDSDREQFLTACLQRVL